MDYRVLHNVCSHITLHARVCVTLLHKIRLLYSLSDSQSPSGRGPDRIDTLHSGSFWNCADYAWGDINFVVDWSIKCHGGPPRVAPGRRSNRKTAEWECIIQTRSIVSIAGGYSIFEIRFSYPLIHEYSNEIFRHTTRQKRALVWITLRSQLNYFVN